MARRYVMTARRKAALRKAQLASARKRKGSRRRKVVAGVVGVVAVGSVLGYRSYNTKVEIAQRKHLEYKAWNKRVSSLWVEFDSDYETARKARPHKQPRRYKKRPASIQSLETIRNVRAQKYGVAGRGANLFGRAITKPSPVFVRTSKIHGPMRAPKLSHIRKYPRGRGYDFLVGKRRVSVDFTTPARRRLIENYR